MDIKELPEAYLKRMKELLGDEYEDFLLTYEKEPYKGLRFNRTKVRPETIKKLVDEWNLKPVKWCEDGYYYEADIRPGLSPYHDAGVYYIQEPSAMLTAEMADIKAEDVVLDLCAAPGGKSTQAAAKCRMLVANEPIAERARILSSNIERMGFDNCIVTSAYPKELSTAFISFFDKIIIDAPCSGEGMMRKDDNAIAEWSEDNVSRCIERQKEILSSLGLMLKSGGYVIYSTCTFEEGENEKQVYDFLSAHPGFELVKMHRLMPHREDGEGHFCAVMRKKETELSIQLNGKSDSKEKSEKADKAALTLTMNTIKSFLQRKGIHVLRCGVEKGELKKGRDGRNYYIPSHAEALAKKYDTDIEPRINISSDEICRRYLSGETIDLSSVADGDIDLSNARNGFVTVYYDGYSLGNAKLVNNILKNHYPKGLRHM